LRQSGQLRLSWIPMPLISHGSDLLPCWTCDCAWHVGFLTRKATESPPANKFLRAAVLVATHSRSFYLRLTIYLAIATLCDSAATAPAVVVSMGCCGSKAEGESRSSQGPCRDRRVYPSHQCGNAGVQVTRTS
jgi:hypothetical protein